MRSSVHDLKSFYNTKMGRVVRRILKARIREIWNNTRTMRVVGVGYASPYLRDFLEEAERVFAIMPAAQGAHHWPQDDKNLVCLAEESELPLEASSVDRIVLVHNLEFSEFPQAHLAEIWRILKPSGRVLVIVPCRSGFWARADWSPLGQGKPYSAEQLNQQMRDAMFLFERAEHALFMPPIKFAPLLRLSHWIERIGQKVLPFMGGVHMMEFSKQLYAGANSGGGSKVTVRGRGLMGRPVPSPRSKI